ncbi:MAG: GtrA family protein [Minisyncoccales bacterium]
MNKFDAIIAAAIGEATAWYFINLLGEQGAVEKLGGLGQYLWSLAIIFPVLAALALWIASLIGKKFVSIYQLAKFLLIGVIATIFDLGTLAFFINVSQISSGLGFNLFKGASFIIATVLKYIPDKYWAFKKKESANVKKEFIRFFAVTLIGLGVNVFIANFIVNVMGPQFGLPAKLWANLGGIGATIVTFAWNFIGYKFIVFKK